MPFQPRPYLALEPCIQDMREEYICHYGRDAPALHDACLGVAEYTVFHDASVEPRANEAQEAPIVAPLA
jgi:hypothetical protein